jgi:hypothetical protein
LCHFLAGVVLVLLAACGGGGGAGGGSAGAPSASPSTPPKANAEQMIAKCEQAHGMRGAESTTDLPPIADQIGPLRMKAATIYQQCTWPPAGVGNDGFVQIRQTVTRGPDEADVGSAFYSSVFSAPCTTLTITVQGLRAGLEDRRTEIRGRLNQVIETAGFTGKVSERSRSSLPVQPPPNTLVVLHNAMFAPTMATCVPGGDPRPQPTPGLGTLKPDDAVNTAFETEWNEGNTCHPVYPATPALPSRAAGCPITQRLETKLNEPNPTGPTLDAICRCESVATSLSMERVQASGSKGVVQGTAMFDANPSSQHYRFTVVRENGGWLLDDVACADGTGSAYGDPKIC